MLQVWVYQCRLPKMIVYAVLWVMLCGTTYADSHRLEYIYTFFSGGTDNPEFTVEGFVDHEKFVHYDSSTNWMKPATEWIKANVGADYWERQTQILLDTQQAVQNQSKILFSETHVAHIFRYKYGCQWNNENGLTDEFNELDYDGKSFSRLDSETQNFIAPVHQVFKTAMKLYCDPDGHGLEGQNRKQTCIEWLRKYVSYKRRGLEGKVPPKVSLLQNDSCSPVVICHVTGFYPRDIAVTWQKNGLGLKEDVELVKTVTNEDGTFQIRSHLRVTPENRKKDRYACVVQHNSLEQDIVLPLIEDTRTEVHACGITLPGVIIGIIIIIIIISAAVLWKRGDLIPGCARRRGEDAHPHAGPESDENTSLPDSGHNSASSSSISVNITESD
ncbi:hypothetical protein GJAV_G00039100 [Gymnothorax javanicus]|nr:hypothetical protein GJAV_G00039100 [Gymnothorax javanicus]